MEEDRTLTTSGELKATDPDAGDAVTWSIGTSQGAYGSLTVGDDGRWSYVLDNDAAQGLKAGETFQDAFAVQVTDSAGAMVEQTVAITVVGTNDAPAVEDSLVFSIQEDGSIRLSSEQLLQGASDVDDAELSIANLVINDGRGTLAGPDQHGDYVYTPPEDFNGTVTLAYDVTDGRASTPQTAAIDVAAVADAPILTVTVGPGASIGEDAATGGAGGELDTSLGLDISIEEPKTYDVVGTEGGDFVRGGEGGQSIEGGGGADVLYGDADYIAKGEDFIHGGAGDDQITGGDSSDTILGGTGRDTIYGDYQGVSPDAGDDVIDAGEGDDIVIGGEGDDQIAGGSGSDLIQGDFDWETSGGGADRIDAGSGDDTVIGGGGKDVIAGGEGDDTLYGDYRWTTSHDSDDIIAGGKGDDLIYGGGGADVAVFAGSRGEYEITQNSDGSYTVSDLVAGRDGTDKIYDVETFRFSDGDISNSDLLTKPGSPPELGVVVYPLDIAAALGDPDGSETLSNVTINLADVPEEVIFSAGSLQDGAWVLTPDELGGLTMTVPADAPAFQLQISATAVEADGGDARTTTVSVEVGGIDQGEDSAAAGDLSGRVADIGEPQQPGGLDADAPPDHAFTASAAEEDRGALGRVADERADDGGQDRPDAASDDPLRPYQDLAAERQPPSTELEPSEADRGAADAEAPDMAGAAGDEAPGGQSADDDYMAFAEPQASDHGQPVDPGGGEQSDIADYTQLAGAPTTEGGDQGPPPPDQIPDFAPEASPDVHQAPHEDGGTAPEPMPDMSPPPDHENH